MKSGSPTKSSPMGPEETVDTSAVLRGTPIPKRRTSQGYGLYTINSPFGSSPTSPTRSAITKSPKRGTAKKSSQFLAPPPDRPIFARSRPQSRHLGFATPSEPASRIRRIASVGDFLSRNSLPNASTQRRTPAVNNEPTPGGEDTTTNGNGTNGNAIGLDWVTPRNYQEAKPDPAAFHSTGFIPKRGRMSLGDSSTSIHQPDTPSKKTNPFLASSNSVPNIAAPRKEFSHPTLDGRPIIPAKSTMVNINVSRRQAPFRGAGDDVSPTAAFGRRRKPDDVADSGLPPTPTKPVYSNVNLSTIFGNVGGTKRKNTCRLSQYRAHCFVQCMNQRAY